LSIRAANRELATQAKVRVLSRLAGAIRSSPEDDCRRALEETKARLAEAEARWARHELEAAELNHRVANSRQIAASFLIFQERKLPDGPAKEALNAASTRIGAVATFHRHLAGHTGEAALDLAGFLGRLVPEIGETCGLRCQLDVEPVDVAADTAMNIGLVINELAINARKHAYGGSEGGVLRIRCEQDNADLTLRVTDEGPGVPDGFDLQNGSLGISIVQTIVRQLNAKLNVETGTAGTCFVFIMPLQRAPRQAPNSRSYSASGTP
jgi:two-component sensor histidine kinase